MHHTRLLQFPIFAKSPSNPAVNESTLHEWSTNRTTRTAACLKLTCATLLLAACGGGGGSGGGGEPPEPPNPPNPPPSQLTHCEGNENGVFINVSSALGLCYDATQEDTLDGDEAAHSSGGLALVDIDRDGQLELLVAHGDHSKGRLFRYNGERFIAIEDGLGIAPSRLDKAGYFVDLDADGWPDFVSVQENSVETFANDQSGRFSLSERFGILHDRPTHSMVAADIDLDDDLDLFFAHFGGQRPAELSQYLWRNLGSGEFEDQTERVWIYARSGDSDSESLEAVYSAQFSDVRPDRYPDLLVAGYPVASRTYKNQAGRDFRDVTDATVTQNYGRGSALGDYDSDGDFDWFVAGAAEGEEADYVGNRLYQNDGNGNFEDVAEAAGLLDTGDAWGACFADFDNDRNLDLFITQEGGSRLYMSNADGSFSDSTGTLGIAHNGSGRGLVCADYDRDGKVDIFIANQGNSPKVYKNDHANSNHYLSIDLTATGGNRDAIGALVTVISESGTQVREMRLGATYLSQGPSTLHFGLGPDSKVDRVEVKWPGPGRQVTSFHDINADQYITLEKPPPEPLALVVAGGEGRGLYLPGEEVPIRANEAPEGLSFSHWSSTGGGSFVDRRSSVTSFIMGHEETTLRANFLPGPSFRDADISIARKWNEVLLDAIRNDLARPVVHARNLFYLSAAMYDGWAFFQDTASAYLFENSAEPDPCTRARDSEQIEDAARAQEVALSFAAYRLIRHRFDQSPGRLGIIENAKTLMGAIQVDAGFDAADPAYSSDEYAAQIGNRIANCYILFGLGDESNESEDYANRHYKPANSALEPHLPGNPNIRLLDRWQPLRLREFVDQAGNPSESEPAFIGAEWGSVRPFALAELDLSINSRDDGEYWVYHDPGAPPSIKGEHSRLYKWGFSLVAVWASHLSPEDGVEIDISPGSIGDIEAYPDRFADYQDFYLDQGGVSGSRGHAMNPVTAQPYDAQIVPRGDYTRVLAEFWADGPDSETPPGHWFVILNSVQDHAEFQRDFKGLGEMLNPLEWDIKAYFALGGAMHDASVAAWGAKGWYDYVRPISALRAMADRGQSSDSTLPSYHATGIPLKPGYVELVTQGDSLVGEGNEHLGKIKFKSWRGPDQIANVREDAAGVGWILAENWWPYQRPTFVTPPFAGYVSGHSTYSRAAAEVLTALTGSAFFPGGKSGFEIKANDFLVFERGPSVDLTLEWATYRDAADQSALSRIWGGIHPPIDDIPGRLMGRRVGEDAFRLAEEYFDGIR